METNYISFPGLGIDTFEVTRSIGEKFQIYWYGILIAIGMVCAFIYAMYRAKNEKVEQDKLIDVALWTIILGVIGARLYYVIFELDSFIAKSDGFWDFLKNVVNVREGGLGIYGGIICGAAGVLIAAKIKKINMFKLVDMAGPAVMIAQAIGRWGNFVNGEAYGAIVPEGHPLYFMRMGLISDNTLYDFNTFSMVYVHPTFLYESLWNVIGFVLINILYKKKKFNGQMACTYLAWYGFGRMFIEGLRTDSLYIGSIRVSQLVGLLCFVIFGGLLIWGLIHSRKFNNPDATLTKLDKLLMPDVEQKPNRFYHKLFKKKNPETIKENTDNGTDN